MDKYAVLAAKVVLTMAVYVGLIHNNRRECTEHDRRNDADAFPARVRCDDDANSIEHG